MALCSCPDICLGVLERIIALTSNPEFERQMAAARSMTKDDLRLAARTGVVWYKDADVSSKAACRDLGNYFYTWVVTILLRLPLQNDCLLDLEHIASRIPCIGTYSTGGLIVSGDVIEHCLREVRTTAHAVDAAVRQQRLELNKIFCEIFWFSKKLDFAVYNIDSLGPPTVGRRCPTYVWASLILHTAALREEQNAHAVANGRHDQQRDSHVLAFHRHWQRLWVQAAQEYFDFLAGVA